eukprot:Awhi_evm2s124
MYMLLLIFEAIDGQSSNRWSFRHISSTGPLMSFLKLNVASCPSQNLDIELIELSFSNEKGQLN